MEKNVYLCSLFDYYGCLLTDIQIKYFESYYFENLLLDEIAENYNVSKNAVSKTLIDVEKKLEYYENKLHLLENNKKIKDILKDDVNKIIDYI